LKADFRTGIRFFCALHQQKALGGTMIAAVFTDPLLKGWHPPFCGEYVGYGYATDTISIFWVSMGRFS
jgi:hypothetical protein